MMIALITIGTEFSSYTSLRYTYSWLFFWATETHTNNVRYCLCNGRKHLGLVGEAGIDKKKKKSPAAPQIPSCWFCCSKNSAATLHTRNWLHKETTLTVHARFPQQGMGTQKSIHLLPKILRLISQLRRTK